MASKYHAAILAVSIASTTNNILTNNDGQIKFASALRNTPSRQLGKSGKSSSSSNDHGGGWYSGHSHHHGPPPPPWWGSSSSSSSSGKSGKSSSKSSKSSGKSGKSSEAKEVMWGHDGWGHSHGHSHGHDHGGWKDSSSSSGKSGKSSGKSSKSSSSSHDGWHSGGWKDSSSSGKSGKGSKSSKSSGKSSKSSGKSGKSSGKSGKSNSSSADGKWVWVEVDDDAWGHGGWSGSGSSGKSGKSGSGSGKSGKSGSGRGDWNDDGHDDDDSWNNDGHVSTTRKCTSNIPNTHEVDILINAMDLYASKEHALLAQWTRAAFHDAGTYNRNIPEGGANGCLLSYFPMREEDANYFMDAPLNTLKALKEFWHSHPDTCMDISNSDMLQFAIFFATWRQSGTPGLDSKKRSIMIDKFKWGRPDEMDCDLAWTDNLPENPTGRAYGGPVTERCLAAGKEIKDKMMDRNGFTAEESVALIGAHTIGQTRHVFGADLAAPWIQNGGDDHTPNGPIFDNEYHAYFADEVTAKTAQEFAIDQTPFNIAFPNWWREGEPENINFLDTDIVLGFPSVDESVHPSFHEYTTKFGKNNDDFLDAFWSALDKMSKLGVKASLSSAKDCESRCSGGDLTQAQTYELNKMLRDALATAEDAVIVLQDERRDEIKNLTTQVDLTTWYVPGWGPDGWTGDSW